MRKFWTVLVAGMFFVMMGGSVFAFIQEGGFQNNAYLHAATSNPFLTIY